MSEIANAAPDRMSKHAVIRERLDTVKHAISELRDLRIELSTPIPEKGKVESAPVKPTPSLEEFLTNLPEQLDAITDSIRSEISYIRGAIL